MRKNIGENIINNLIKLIILLIGLMFQIIFIMFIYGATNTLVNYASIIFEIIKFVSIIYIIYKPVNESYKIIWIILLMFAPVLGFTAYMLWGNNSLPKKLKKKIKYERKKAKQILKTNEDIYETIKSEERKKEAKHLLNISDYPIYYNENIKYFDIGDTYFENLKKDLINAKKYILLEFFIISDGKMWQEIYEILKQKSKENIKIYFIYDSLGSLLKKPKKLKKQLEEININYLSYNPLTPFIRSYINYRDHRKIVVIDGLVAYTGGINIGDEYINVKSRLGHWKDCGVRITGESIKNFIVIFFKLWNLNSKQQVNYKKYIDDIEVKKINDGYIIPFSDNPLNKRNPSENTYINIINNSKKYIYIMTPYLILDRETNQALINASLSGIDVRIMTPFIPDKKLVNACTKSFYGELLNAGIKIYEYKPGFIHSKIIVSDDEVAYIGTANFDYRSFYLNYECGVWIYNTKTELEIKKDFMKSQEKCEEIKLEEWEKRKIDVKILEALLRLISPLL